MANVINSLKLGSGTYVFTTPYATCGTAAAEAAKVAATTPGSNFSLETGAKITVKFTVTNTAANPTLNVNSTGAKAIYYRGQPISASYLMANRTYEFIYNGTQYEFVGDLDSNTAHNHSAGVGLAYGGNAGISGGTYTYKAKLKDETANANDSLARPTANANRLYPVEVDKSGYLAVTVPWNNTDTDTKNTAGSSDTASQIYLIGATSQSTYATTYSHDTVYIDSSSRLTSIYKNTSVAIQNTIRLDPTNQYILVGTGGIGTEPAMYARYGQSSIVWSNNGGTTTYTYAFPTKGGTIALTSDIPSTSSFASLSGANEFTGPNTFTTNVTVKGRNSLIAQGSTALNHTDYSFGKIVHTPDATKDAYTLTLPSKSGTIATTDDAFNPSVQVTSNFGIKGTGYNLSQPNIIDSTSAALVLGGTADGSTTTTYKVGAIANKGVTLTLPTKAGTLATTSDIKIKSASLSGTTLSITLS